MGPVGVDEVLSLSYLSSPTEDGMGYHRILTSFFIILNFEANGFYEEKNPTKT